MNKLRNHQIWITIKIHDCTKSIINLQYCVNSTRFNDILYPFYGQIPLPAFREEKLVFPSKVGWYYIFLRQLSHSLCHSLILVHYILRHVEMSWSFSILAILVSIIAILHVILLISKFSFKLSFKICFILFCFYKVKNFLTCLSFTLYLKGCLLDIILICIFFIVEWYF